MQSKGAATSLRARGPVQAPTGAARLRQRAVRVAVASHADAPAPPPQRRGPAPPSAAAAAASAPPADALSPHDTAAAADAASASPAAAAAGRCPVLGALRPPPVAAVPFWRRLEQFTDPRAFQAEILQDHKIVSTPSQIGFPEFVYAGDGDAARAILAREGDLSKPTKFFSLGDLIDSSATSHITYDPAGHRWFREMMRPAFDASAVGGKLLPDVVAIIDRTLERAAAAGGPVPGHATIKRLTFEVIMTAMIGRDHSPEEFERLHALYKDYTAGIGAWPQLDAPFTRYGRAMNARRALLAIFDADIAAARAAAARGEAVPGQLGTMITAVDDRGIGLPDRAVRELLLTLLFAGHDTTSAAITELIAMLQAHPAVVERLRAEQRAIAARHGDALTAEALDEMEYADAVIRESMRLNPIAAEIYREAARDFEVDGRLIAKGSLIGIPLASLGLSDPRWAAEPPGSPLHAGAFNPDRMLTPEGRRPGDQMPWGHGGRRCLGVHLAMAEMRVFIALWARRYAIDADANTEWVFAGVRAPKNGLPMTVAPLAL